MAKGSKSSPKESPKKGSPKKEKSSSPKDKGSKKSPKNEVEKPPDLPVKLRKSFGTLNSWIEYTFSKYRCPKCYLVLDSFQQFMNHECWRPYYLSKFHIGETQAYACRTCDRVFQTHLSYSKHTCDRLCPEENLPISYRMHFKFFMYWDRRIKQENTYYDADWPYVCRCIKCGNKFKREILYILHTCFQYSLLKPIEVKCLKICRYCKFVFVNEPQYNQHLPYCPRQDRAFCNDFLNTTFLRTIQQFVLGRHCYDFDLHITQKPLEESNITKKPIPVGCETCGLIQVSILEYLYHPCVAGKLITPADLEMTLVCNKCRNMFLNYESCYKHVSHCLVEMFTFVRFNVQELKVALERWVTDVLMNPYLPQRPAKMKCQFCLEIFCDLTNYLRHLCPKKKRYERILLQPISLSEMYICDGCSIILFTATEAVNHSETCENKPLMIQVHPDMTEAVTALEVWSRLPRLLQMEIYIGMADVHEKCPRRSLSESENTNVCPDSCYEPIEKPIY